MIVFQHLFLVVPGEDGDRAVEERLRELAECLVNEAK